MLISHYGKDVELQLETTEILASADTDEEIASPASSSPTVFWHELGANFVVVKTDEQRYRTQYFYTPHDLHDIGSFNSLKECLSFVLKHQETTK